MSGRDSGRPAGGGGPARGEGGREGGRGQTRASAGSGLEEYGRSSTSHVSCLEGGVCVRPDTAEGDTRLRVYECVWKHECLPASSGHSGELQCPSSESINVIYHIIKTNNNISIDIGGYCIDIVYVFRLPSVEFVVSSRDHSEKLHSINNISVSADIKGV